MERFNVEKFVEQLEYRVVQPAKRRDVPVRAVVDQARVEVDKVASRIVDKYMERHD